jgi:SAM-dependent methyltransferase
VNFKIELNTFMAITSNTEIDGKKDSISFNAVAELYDTYRPSYPEELVESIISTTGIQPDGRIPEIGCGTGKATMLFARRNFSMLCIEHGENLAAFAARKLHQFSRVEFETIAFEDWAERPNEFDLVISAQAFHWIPKEIGFAKVARALKTTGYIAPFWNLYPAPTGEIAAALRTVYQEYAPELVDRSNDDEELIKQRETEITESGYFGPVSVTRFPWVARYNAAQYTGLLGTYSDHLRLPPEIKEPLLEGVAGVINSYGGYIEKPYAAVLYLAQKAQEP